MTCEKQSWCLSSGQPNSETWEMNRFGHLAYSASLTLPFPPFPGGPVVQNPPADAEDTGSAPGLGWRHVRWHSQACAPGACAPQQETSPRPRARRPRAENALCSSKGPRQSKKKDQSLTKLPGAITLSTLVKVSQREQPLAETWKACSSEGSRIQMQVWKQS